MSPQHLARRAAAGDDVAFARLCRDLRDWLWHHTARFYAAGLERDDMLQVARIALHAACKDYDAHAGSSFMSFAELVVDRRLADAATAATRRKHEPLNASRRLHWPLDGRDESVTVEDVLPAPSSTDPARIVESRCELRIVLDTVEGLSDMEATVLARRVNGASCDEAGEGLGSGSPYKLADNALIEHACKVAELLARGKLVLCVQPPPVPDED